MAFLDVTKAYDKAWSEAIMYVMHKEGIRDRHWYIIKKLNENITVKIKTKHGKTREIHIKDSIRQGGVLSVLEYGVLMDEINKDLEKKPLRIEIDDKGTRAPCLCSEIRARYHPNPTPDRWPLESLPLGSETGIQVTAVVGIGDHLGRQLPVSLLVPVSVASVDTTLLPTKFWRRNRVEPEVGALVSILKFGKPQASVIGIGGRLEGSGSLSPSERWFHYS